MKIGASGLDAVGEILDRLFSIFRFDVLVGVSIFALMVFSISEQIANPKRFSKLYDYASINKISLWRVKRTDTTVFGWWSLIVHKITLILSVAVALVWIVWMIVSH